VSLSLSSKSTRGNSFPSGFDTETNLINTLVCRRSEKKKRKKDEGEKRLLYQKRVTLRREKEEVW